MESGTFGKHVERLAHLLDVDLRSLAVIGSPILNHPVTDGRLGSERPLTPAARPG
jgi:hypothetical protein